MKRPHRFEPPAFNPEKFLAQEKKKNATSVRFSAGLFVPITFSKERMAALITRVLADQPNAFQLESDCTKYASFTSIWKKEIGKELTVYGIASEPMLITYLMAAIISHPLYKKAARARKTI